MPSRLCRACSDWHDLNQPWPRACANHFRRTTEARSDLPRPMVISDDVDVSSPISGERFTSKSELRRHYVANGVRELGNDTIKPRDNDEADIALAPIEQEVAQAFNSVS
jgi:hypothetical protein